MTLLFVNIYNCALLFVTESKTYYETANCIAFRTTSFHRGADINAILKRITVFFSTAN